MQTVSVKLPDETKSRLDSVAAREGMTPHAVMVGAIEAEIDRREKHASFIEDALRARDEMLASAKGYAGDEVIAYLRSRARGESPAPPKLKNLKTLIKRSR